MEENITFEKDNITYNLNLKLISELIIFHIESKEIPKKTFEESFSESDLKSKHKIFALYGDIKSIFEFLKDSIKDLSKTKIDEKDDAIEIQIILPLKNVPTINLEIFKKNDVNEQISELFSLYKDLKNEKDKEIKDLILKKKEDEEKLGKMNNEIKELKEEIKNLKEQNKKDKKEIEIDYEKKINESKNINRNRLRNIDSKLDELEQKVEKNTSKLIDLKLLMDKIEENYSFLQNQIIFLTFNNFENFKTIFEEYYNKLPRRYSGFSNLFDEYYKPSYNIIVEIIFENIKRNKEGNNKKIIEHSENKKYERYNKENGIGS